MVAETEISFLSFSVWKIVSSKMQIRKPLHTLASPAPNSIRQKPRGLSKYTEKTVQIFSHEHYSMFYSTISSSTHQLFLREKIWNAQTTIVCFTPISLGFFWIQRFCNTLVFWKFSPLKL